MVLSNYSSLRNGQASVIWFIKQMNYVQYIDIKDEADDA